MNQTERNRQAYATAASALKALGEPDAQITERLKELGEKCDIGPMAVEVWRPFGGATSFTELDTYERGQQMRQEFDELNWQLRGIMQNILDAPDLTAEERASRIAAVADDFAARAQAVPAEVDAETEGEAMANSSAEAGGSAGGRFWISKLLRSRKAKAPAKDQAEDVSSFKAFKGADGSWRWFAVYSNRYYDKEGQVFPEAAHKEYVAWVDQTGNYPELWDWHVPVGLTTYSDGRKGMGKADLVDYDDGLAMAGGYFYPEFADVALALSSSKDLATSHGYEYPDRGAKGLQPDGSYPQYFTFEISPLPRERAANEMTLFLPVATKEEIMQLNPTKRAHLVGHLGEEKVKALETGLATLSKDLKENGIAFKDLDELETTPPAAAASGTVPGDGSTPATAAMPAAGGDSPADPAENVKAVKEAMASAIKEAIEPLAEQVKALGERITPLESYFGPRFTPAPGRAPSASPDNLVDGRTADAKAMKAGDKEGADERLPEHLRWYAGQMGNAIAAAASGADPASAGVSTPPAGVA